MGKQKIDLKRGLRDAKFISVKSYSSLFMVAKFPL
jgi:hypothetical protein